MRKTISDLFRSTILTGLTALLALSVFGQDEAPIRVETNLVNVNVSVSDSGNFVSGLKKADFVLFDNGVKQEIEYFSAEGAPISYGFVYDLHPTTDDRTKAVLESMREFTGTLGGQDDFFALIFNERGSLMVDFVPTAEQLRTNLSGQYREPNALYDAIYLAAGKMRERRNQKRVLVVITDSADHNSVHRFQDILDQLENIDVQIYAVVWDETERWEYADVTRSDRRRNALPGDASGLDRAALRELARRTGGDIQSPTVQNANELYGIFRQVRSEMGRQYTLGFYPAAPDGKWHDLRVGLIRSGETQIVTYRQGYQSPEDK